MYLLHAGDQPLSEAHPFGALRAGSGPLLDRIDIHIEVPRVEYDKLSDDRFGEPSAAIRELHLTARAYHRIPKLARTIADVAEYERIETAHLAEAIQYRPRRQV